MAEPRDTNDQNLALASLLLDHAKPPVGHKPTTAELWDWMHGHLTAQRAVEVESHVARDPDTFEQWRQLRQSDSEFARYESDQSPSTTDGFVHWMQVLRDRFTDFVQQPAKGLAVGLTMVMVFVSAGLWRQSPDITGPGQQADFWAEWQSPKQSAVNNLDAEQQQHLQMLVAGVAEHLSVNQLPVVGPDGEALPVVDCAVTGACDENTELLISLGQNAAAARAVCLVGESLQVDESLPATLIKVESSGLALTIHRPLREWIAASTPDARCNAANTVISRALVVLPRR